MRFLAWGFIAALLVCGRADAATPVGQFTAEDDMAPDGARLPENYVACHQVRQYGIIFLFFASQVN